MAKRPDGQHPLEDLMDEALDSAKNGKVTLDSLLDAFGNRSFGPLIALFGLIAMTPPLGGIPGIPSTMGLLTILLAVQILFGRDRPWVPGFIRDKGFSKDKVAKARDKAIGIFKRIDSLIGPRLEWITGPVGQWLAALMCVVVAALMPPLEILPFAAAVPAAALLMFGLALTARDGLLMLIGYAVAAGALYLGVRHFVM